MILGLTGSMGSGKSFVADCLRDFGAVIISADRIAHELTASGTPAFEEITREFGSDVLLPDGSLDRRALARVVFSDSDKLKRLEAIIHPRVRDEELRLIEAAKDVPLVVLEVPLLYETGADALCDAVVSVSLNERVREARLSSSRDLSLDEIRERLSRQISQAEKDRRADFVISNDGKREETRRAVEKLHERLVSPEKTFHT